VTNALTAQKEDGNKIMAKSFETMVKVEATRLRDLFRSRDISHLNFTVTVSGPVDSGELAIQFQIASSSWGDDPVKGSTINAVVDEFCRRKGWRQNNDYLALPYLDSHTEE
jgi:methylaspartate ammonia-lyase